MYIYQIIFESTFNVYTDIHTFKSLHCIILLIFHFLDSFLQLEKTNVNISFY